MCVYVGVGGGVLKGGGVSSVILEVDPSRLTAKEMNIPLEHKHASG